MQLFYAPGISSDQTYLLPDEEAAHCIGVLRYKEGQQVTLTDGKGFFYEAVITRIARKEVTLSVIKHYRVELERAYKLHMAIAPTKNIERFEWFLEKATEIGIDEITPILAENSERKAIRTERLEKILVSAIKQSVKAHLPVLNPLITFREFIREKTGMDQHFIAYCNSDDRFLLPHVYQAGNNVTILVGPEGDFSIDEVKTARNKGYIPISLGGSRLRTETAGVVACHTIYLENQRNSKT